MANAASDTRGFEQAIWQRLIENRVVDVVVAVSANMFYGVTPSRPGLLRQRSTREVELKTRGVVDKEKETTIVKRIKILVK